MKDYKLRPCPFCGAEEIGIKMEGYFQPWKSDGIKTWFKAYCYCCGVETDYMANTTMQKAIDHCQSTGNRRGRGQNAEQLHCSVIKGRD